MPDDALNELAGRLAILGRRNKKLQVDYETGGRMLATIREDAKAVSAAI